MKCYAAKNKNINQRLSSSSGGIFPLIAEYIISNGGIVYGAAYNKLKVEHIGIYNTKDIVKLQGSKYAESDLKDTYKEIKEKLDSQIVLFCGTPCQVKGLKLYLKKEYDNLYCIDFICHGTPKKEEYNKYIKSLGKIKSINFKDKSKSWKQYSVKKVYADHEEFELYQNNSYMQDFIKNKNLKESCFNCKNKGFASDSDIKLGDFWGIQHIYPQFDDDKGISAVMVISEKGELLFNSIKIKTEFIETTIDKIMQDNPCLMNSAKR